MCKRLHLSTVHTSAGAGKYLTTVYPVIYSFSLLLWLMPYLICLTVKQPETVKLLKLTTKTQCNPSHLKIELVIPAEPERTTANNTFLSCVWTAFTSTGKLCKYYWQLVIGLHLFLTKSYNKLKLPWTITDREKNKYLKCKTLLD